MIQRIPGLVLMFSLSSCLLFWQKATEEEESGTVGTEIPALLAALSGCSISEAVTIEAVIDLDGEALMMAVEGTVEGATDYYFYGRTGAEEPWEQFYSMPAAEYTSYFLSAGVLPVSEAYTSVMIRAASPECLGPPSNVVEVQAQGGPLD